MNYYRYLASISFVVCVLTLGTAHALVVDFERYDLSNPNPHPLEAGVIKRSFIGIGGGVGAADPTNPIENSPRASTVTGQFHSLTSNPSSTGIRFSGGVLLIEPSDGRLPTPGTVTGGGGTVYYGTAYAPSAGVPTETNAMGEAIYTNTITIDIDPLEMVTRVSGLLVNGLNTSAFNNFSSSDYNITYTFGGSSETQAITAPFVFGDEALSFGLDTSLLIGDNFITQVEIEAVGIDFNGPMTNPNQRVEWDFLLASVSFNEAASPVPLPAGLPLFMSALLGGLVFARPKKKIEQ